MKLRITKVYINNDMENPRLDPDELDPDSDNIEFQITDFYTPENDRNNQKPIFDIDDYGNKIFTRPDEYKIIIYGTTLKGDTVTLRVNGYSPYFYVKPPPEWGTSKKKLMQKTADLREFLLNTPVNKGDYSSPTISRRMKDHLEYMKIVAKKEYWGFTNEEDFYFIKIKVKSLGLYNAIKRFFEYNTKEDFRLYGSNLDPMLRFMHDVNIQPCGWIKLNAGDYTFIEITENEFSRSGYNIECDYNNIKPYEINRIAPLLIMSTDIECTSSHGDFPVAKKDYKKLAVDLISIAKNQKCSKEMIKSMIVNAFFKTEQFTNGIVNCLYTKSKVKRENIEKSTEDIIDDVVNILNNVNKLIKSGMIKDVDEEDDEDEESNNSASNLTNSAKLTVYEKSLVILFNKNFPELKGDKIIQIGSTFNRYGSDEIIYKHIISLGGCEDSEGIDIETYKNEKDVILAWKDLINRLDPDVIGGYNTFSFDFRYIAERAQELDIYDDLILDLGKIKGRKSILETKNLSSSALGENIMYLFAMDGIISIDMLKDMQRNQKLDSFKLDNVAKTFLGDQKDDLKPKEIFEKFKGSDEDRAVIARYCIQDCALVNRLIHKMKVLENNIGMGNVCYVPLNWLFMRGQGIKIFSLVSKEANKKNYVIPVLQRPKSLPSLEDDGYEGAIVLEPETGMYLDDNIIVFDYNSLYPSSMIDRNLSHDSIILDDEKYGHLDDDPNSGVSYNIVEYDIYQGKGDKKIVVGKKICKYVQYSDGRKGILPTILMDLLAARKFTRKLMEYRTVTYNFDGEEIKVAGLVEESDKISVKDLKTKKETIIEKEKVVKIENTYNQFELAVLDSRQNAYKVTANSLYGQTGSRTSQIYMKDIAACTTARGREMIMIAKKFVEDKHDCEVIYGDSVMSYTPILVKNKITGEIFTKSISDISDETWKPYDAFKAGDSNRKEKQQIELNDYQTWTDNGWSDIKRVIKHKCNKAIYRILTHTGLVDVTEDHSLLSDNKEIVKPTEVKIGTKLLYGFPKLYGNYNVKNDDVIEFNSQLEIQKFFMNVSNKNDISIGYYDNKYIIIKNYKQEQNVIKKIEKLYDCYDDYVYDLETEEGVFQAGIGNIIVKNTDSIFCKFPIYNNAGQRVYGKEALPFTIKLGQHIEREIKTIMPVYQNLAYEKVLWPFILLSKKRYVGNLYENDPNKCKLKSMGLAIKRRDYAPIVKVIYGGILDILVNKSNLGDSIRFLKSSLQDLIDGKMDISNLIVSKTLKGSYKDPTKIAHKVLADRIGERDEGNKPMINERVPYIYIQTPPGVEIKLQGDRIEHPDYIKEHNLLPDYKFYITNQLKKPIGQLFTLCVEQIPGYYFEPGYWMQMDTELEEKDIYKNEKKRKSRIQALKMKVVENLLFDEFIDKLTPPKIAKPKKDADKPKKSATKKQKTLDITDGEKVEEVKDEFYKLEIFTKIYQRKSDKYRTEVKLINSKGKKVWDILDEGKKIMKKTDSDDIIYSVTQALQKALKYIIENCKSTKIIFSSHGIYIYELRNALKHYDIREYIISKQNMLDNPNNNQMEIKKEVETLYNFIDILDDLKEITFELENSLDV